MEEIKDITEIKIDAELSKEEKIKSFIREINNPYEFRVGKIKVRTSFAENSITLQDRMTQYFEQLLA